MVFVVAMSIQLNLIVIFLILFKKVIKSSCKVYCINFTHIDFLNN